MTLLHDILDYCERTRSSETALGTQVARDGRYVARMRKGLQPRPKTERLFRHYMIEHPDGVVSGGPGRQPIPRGANGMTDPVFPHPPIVDRTPCFYCGVRGDIGCQCRKS